jgi:pSer/pThr/pTyr-binding forkhead associated (FHA) protein
MTRGSFVGQRKIETPTALDHGDEVQIGRFKFVFRPAESPGSTETEG